jgi:ATP-dependent Clp protease ATP-binding subunit ClpA
VIEIAFKLAASTDSLVGTEHVLLALSKEGEGIAAHMLGDLGATPDRIAHEVDLLKDPES